VLKGGSWLVYGVLRKRHVLQIKSGDLQKLDELFACGIIIVRSEKFGSINMADLDLVHLSVFGAWQ
jgi:hypothetical protein